MNVFFKKLFSQKRANDFLLKQPRIKFITGKGKASLVSDINAIKKNSQTKIDNDYLYQINIETQKWKIVKTNLYSFR